MIAKLYLVTRADLSAGQQAVQAAHALREWVEGFPSLDREWYTTSNTLAFLAVKDEASLMKLCDKAARQGLPFACFREPDRQNELTAVAFGPPCRKLVSHLPLALSGVGRSCEGQAGPPALALALASFAERPGIQARNQEDTGSISVRRPPLL